jgi:outer membrane receptor protein involved in Fe transport
MPQAPVEHGLQPLDHPGLGGIGDRQAGIAGQFEDIGGQRLGPLERRLRPIAQQAVIRLIGRDFADKLVGRFNVGSKYSTEYNTGSDLAPQKMQDAYALVNARIGIGAKDKRWAVELWGQNLTDENYAQVGFDAPLQTGSYNAFLGAPRTYGITLRVMY